MFEMPSDEQGLQTFAIVIGGPISFDDCTIQMTHQQTFFINRGLNIK